MAYHYIIYADILFALNFFLDFFLIWASGRFLRLRASLIRQLLAAILGAGYAAGLLIVEISFFYSWPLAILASMLILRLAFAWQNWRAYLRLMAIFYLIAFAMAGAALAAASLLGSRGISFEPVQTVQISALAFAILMAAILARRGFEVVKRNWQKDSFILALEIAVNGQTASLKALIDTGNDLREPISGKPVLVVEYKAVQALLPLSLRQLWQEHAASDPSQILANANQQVSLNWQKRLRLIPFASIGKNHGLLLGFQPDQILIYHNQEQHFNNQVIIALYDYPLGKGHYQAVMNSAVMTYLEQKIS